MQCPNVTNTLGVCVEECSSDNDCDDVGTICCRNGCGRTCVTGNSPAQLCPSIRRRNEEAGLLGSFRPSCEEDGSFSPVQCHEGFCWCVDVTSGQPVSEGVRGAERPTCGGCTRPGSDEIIRTGESYSTEDGCNTWQVLKQLVL